MPRPTESERALRRATAQRERSTAAWVEAIRAAHGAGLSHRKIAPLAGVSHQRVAQILRDE